MMRARSSDLVAKRDGIVHRHALLPRGLVSSRMRSPGDCARTGQRQKHVERQSAHWRCGVESLGDSNERDAVGIEDLDNLTKSASERVNESIRPVDDNHVIWLCTNVCRRTRPRRSMLPPKAPIVIALSPWILSEEKCWFADEFDISLVVPPRGSWNIPYLQIAKFSLQGYYFLTLRRPRRAAIFSLFWSFR